MTYKEALQRSRLQEGGHVMALDGACVMENWDSSITSAEGVKGGEEICEWCVCYFFWDGEILRFSDVSMLQIKCAFTHMRFF